MSARTLRRTGKRVASTLEDVSDKITEVADPVREETEKASGGQCRHPKHRRGQWRGEPIDVAAGD